MKLNLLFLSLISFILISCQSKNENFSINTIHGNIVINDPLALELINHKSFQRMKNIQQHGLNHKALHEPSFTRYEHSLEFMLYLRNMVLAVKNKLQAFFMMFLTQLSLMLVTPSSAIKMVSHHGKT